MNNGVIGMFNWGREGEGGGGTWDNWEWNERLYEYQCACAVARICHIIFLLSQVREWILHSNTLVPRNALHATI